MMAVVVYRLDLSVMTCASKEVKCRLTSPNLPTQGLELGINADKRAGTPVWLVQCRFADSVAASQLV